MPEQSNQDKINSPENKDLGSDADSSLVRRMPAGAARQAGGVTTPYIKGAENTPAM